MSNLVALPTPTARAGTPAPAPAPAPGPPIDVQRVLSSIDALLASLQLDAAPEYALPPNNLSSRRLAEYARATDPIVYRAHDKLSLTRMRMQLDAQFRLLDKVLPQLKAVDYTDSTPTQQLDDRQLAERLRGMIGRLEHKPGT